MALCQNSTAMGQHISWGNMPGHSQQGITWNRQFVLLIFQILVNHGGNNITQELCESHSSSSPAFCLQPQAGRNNLGEGWEQGMQTGSAFSWHLFLACTIQQIWLPSGSSNQMTMLTVTDGSILQKFCAYSSSWSDFHSTPWQWAPHLKCSGWKKCFLVFILKPHLLHWLPLT